MGSFSRVLFVLMARDFLLPSCLDSPSLVGSSLSYPTYSIPFDETCFCVGREGGREGDIQSAVLLFFVFPALAEEALAALAVVILPCDSPPETDAESYNSCSPPRYSLFSIVLSDFLTTFMKVLFVWRVGAEIATLSIAATTASVGCQQNCSCLLTSRERERGIFLGMYGCIFPCQQVNMEQLFRVLYFASSRLLCVEQTTPVGREGGKLAAALRCSRPHCCC